jgi:hypothetical protein
MNWRLIIVVLLMPSKMLMAQENDSTSSSIKLTARLDIPYTPISTVKVLANKTVCDFYDSFAYRLSVEYYIAENISIGPGFEYLTRRVSTDGTFSDNILMYSYYLDGRYSYPLTDSGNSFLVLGLGSGIATLKEENFISDNGFCIYGIIGLDIGLSPKVGLDLLYRYGSTRVTINNDREYRIERSALQAGISYRFKL